MPAASFTDGKHGKAMGRRWLDKDKPAPPEETRTPKKVIEDITKKLKEVSGDKSV